MVRRLAMLLVALLALLPALARKHASRPRPTRGCEVEGRGVSPRLWVGCRADPGPQRELSGAELLLFGRPVDLNSASAVDLEPVPGLSARLAAEIVTDRERRGRFETVDQILRVRGIGPARLARARPHLAASGPARP